MPTIFSHKPTLRGDRVTLRPIRASDADPLDAIMRHDPEIAILTGSVHSLDEPVTNPPIDRMRETYGQWSTADDRLVLAVIDNDDGDCRVLGEVVLNEWDEENLSCGFRTLIGAAGCGRGLGTEATRLIVAYGLQELGLHRIALQVYAFNPRARHVYEKVGFRHEGTGRDALRFDGGWVDVDYMAALSTDPEPGLGMCLRALTERVRRRRPTLPAMRHADGARAVHEPRFAFLPQLPAGQDGASADSGLIVDALPGGFEAASDEAEGDVDREHVLVLVGVPRVDDGALG